jgi:outer membrane protein OmpA-like peptidoglycan-associated protein
MNTLKFAFILLIAIISGFSTPCSSIDGLISNNQEQDEVVIPPEAHKKAIQALKALGPTRGAKKIDYRMVKIIGIAPRGIEARSEKIKAALKDLGAKVTETEVHIDLLGDVLFDFDKWDIRQDAVKTLAKVGEIIKAYKSPNVTIAGHTDSKGSEDYNQNLSKKRAESVKSWLIKNSGIDAEIMETIGYGESKPVAPNTTDDGSDNPEGRQKNRRVEILIKKK